MFWKSPKKPPGSGNWAPGAAGARAHKRTKCADFFCNFGLVVDLSPTGAGLLTEAQRFRPGMRDTVRIEAEPGPIELDATVIWVAPSGDHRYRVGFRFDSRQHRDELKVLCRRLREEELDRRDGTRF